MMKTVKHTIYSIGDQSGEFAKTIGSGTVDLAHRFGIGSAGFAKRIGPRRGLLGLVAIAAAVGGSIVLMRYLRARKANAVADISSEDLSNGLSAGARPGKYNPSAMPGSH
jgi:hypothetical protein